LSGSLLKEKRIGLYIKKNKKVHNKFHSSPRSLSLDWPGCSAPYSRASQASVLAAIKPKVQY